MLCIDSDGENIGVIHRDDAIKKAQEKELDLVMIADGKDGIPVCKIVEYGKFKYELSKKNREIAKKQRESVIKTKEIKFHPSTDENDLKNKASKVEKFLNDGDRVKVSITFRGREITHKNVGMDTLNKFISLVPNLELINEPFMQGRVLSVLCKRKKDVKRDNN